MTTTIYTTEERKERIEYYRDWAIHLYQMLGLDHWDIRFKYDPPPSGDDAMASMHRNTGSYSASVYLSDDFFTDDREGQRVTILHEFLHCQTRLMWEPTTVLDEVLSPGEWRMFCRSFEVGEESLVDSLSRALAPLFLLPPPWPPEPAAAEPEEVSFKAVTVFTDGERSERTMVLGPEAVATLAEAVAAAQAAAMSGVVTVSVASNTASSLDLTPHSPVE